MDKKELYDTNLYQEGMQSLGFFPKPASIPLYELLRNQSEMSTPDPLIIEVFGYSLNLTEFFQRNRPPEPMNRGQFLRSNLRNFAQLEELFMKMIRLLKKF